MKVFVYGLLLCVGVSIILASVQTTRASFSSQADTSGNIFRTASSFGTTPIASILFESPTGKTIKPNELSTISMSVTGLGERNVDGIQVIVTLSGSVPPDVTFQSATILGMSPILQSVSGTGDATTVTLIQVSTNPLAPLNTHGQQTLLGTLQFTSPASGSLTLTVDPVRTKILETSTAINLISTQTPTVFAFQ